MAWCTWELGHPQTILARLPPPPTPQKDTRLQAVCTLAMFTADVTGSRDILGAVGTRGTPARTTEAAPGPPSPEHPHPAPALSPAPAPSPTAAVPAPTALGMGRQRGPGRAGAALAGLAWRALGRTVNARAGRHAWTSAHIAAGVTRPHACHRCSWQRGICTSCPACAAASPLQTALGAPVKGDRQTDRQTTLPAERNGEQGQGALRCWGRAKEQPGCFVKPLSPPKPLSVQEWWFCRGEQPPGGHRWPVPSKGSMGSTCCLCRVTLAQCILWATWVTRGPIAPLGDRPGEVPLGAGLAERLLWS